MPIPLLPAYPVGFPSPERALSEPDGLLAAGGVLTSEWLIEAYARGIFPWFDSDDEHILWWCPSERAVLQPGCMKVRKSLAKRIRNAGFHVTFDQCFTDVITACSEPRAGATGTWITPAMQQAYISLHENTRLAHSVEVWQDDRLVGGLYGISLGQVFFGESMFSRVSDASQVGFYHLQRTLAEWDFLLIDCQLENQHLMRLGVETISRRRFLTSLAHNDLALTAPQRWAEVGVLSP